VGLGWNGGGVSKLITGDALLLGALGFVAFFGVEEVIKIGLDVELGELIVLFVRLTLEGDDIVVFGGDAVRLIKLLLFIFKLLLARGGAVVSTSSSREITSTFEKDALLGVEVIVCCLFRVLDVLDGTLIKKVLLMTMLENPLTAGVRSYHKASA